MIELGSTAIDLALSSLFQPFGWLVLVMVLVREVLDFGEGKVRDSSVRWLPGVPQEMVGQQLQTALMRVSSTNLFVLPLSELTRSPSSDHLAVATRLGLRRPVPTRRAPRRLLGRDRRVRVPDHVQLDWVRL